MSTLAELLAGRYRQLPDAAETTGTPFAHDSRSRLAQLLMPGPEQTGVSLGSLPPDHPLAAREHAAADEAWARTPGSPWQRPEALTKALDWYADATSTPKGAATDFVLSNFLGPALGRVPKPLAGRPSSGILERKTEAEYFPPEKPQRPFIDDYKGAQIEGLPERVLFRHDGGRRLGPTGSPLEVDIEGRPLVANVVAGRRTVGGADQGLTAQQVEDLAGRLTTVEMDARFPAGRARSLNCRCRASRLSRRSDGAELVQTGMGLRGGAVRYPDLGETCRRGSRRPRP